MPLKVVIVGVVIAALGPMTFGALLLFAQSMPGCNIGGSGGPAGGCSLWGVSFDWLISWVTPFFVISFFTVPIGLLIAGVGFIAGIINSFRHNSKESSRDVGA